MRSRWMSVPLSSSFFIVMALYVQVRLLTLSSSRKVLQVFKLKMDQIPLSYHKPLYHQIEKENSSKKNDT